MYTKSKEKLERQTETQKKKGEKRAKKKKENMLVSNDRNQIDF
jgi:hypothetical protein